MLALAMSSANAARSVWVAATAQGELPLPVKPSHPACAPLLTIQSFYRAINALALRRGLDPDVRRICARSPKRV